MVIEELKAKAGFGGARLEIQIPKNDYKLDEFLAGKLLLSGGKVNQAIQALTISLIREWSWEAYSVGRDIDLWGDGRGAQSTISVSSQAEYELDGDKGIEEVLSIELANDFKVKAGEINEFPFAFNLSGIQQYKGTDEKWKLQAIADIPFAKDAVAEQKIELFNPGR